MVLDTDKPAAPIGLPEPPEGPLPPEVLFPEARQRRRRRWLRIGLATVLVAGGATVAGVLAGHSRRVPLSSLAVPTMGQSGQSSAAFAAACTGVRTGSLFALTAGGQVEDVDPTTGAVLGTLVANADPRGALALDPTLGRVFVTGRGKDGQPSVWALGCGVPRRVVAPDAELPAVSTDGRMLAYVTLDGSGRQSGVAVAHLTASGRPTAIRQLAGTAEPLPVRVHQLTLGPNGAQLAVWGGFVSPGLPAGTATTGTLRVRSARSLATVKVFNTRKDFSLSLTMPSLSPGAKFPTPRGTGAALYLPNGLIVLVEGGHQISMPYSLQQGGGDAEVVRQVQGTPADLAAGPDGRLAWVAGHTLSVAATAWDFQFGPWALGVPWATAVTHPLPGRYTWAAWTAGSPAPTIQIQLPITMPTLIGMTEHAAVQVLDAMGLSSWVATTYTKAHYAAIQDLPPDSVALTEPGSGTLMGCQCGVTLAVTPGGTPITAGRHRDGGTTDSVQGTPIAGASS